MVATKKVKPKTKAKTRRSRKKKVPSPPADGIISNTIIWKDAFPLVEETYRIGEETLVICRYPTLDSSEFEGFLYQVIRSESLPSFMKNNLKKIKKLLEKEIQHRDKLYEKLSKEQVKSFQTFFQDDDFFERTDEDEYFNHEVEKVSTAYVREYLSTGLYESRARLTNRRYKKALQAHGM